MGGVGLLLRTTVEWWVRILFPYLILWLLLKAPALLLAPQVEAVWLGFGELAVLVAGGRLFLPHWPGCDRDRH
jgi:hypothetical protein